jgi:uncharacterized protein (DUF427 family)
MPSANWMGKVIALAQENEVQIVENNVYFPAHCVNFEYLQASATQSDCAWKGRASYYSLLVDGQRNEDAAWFYPAPKEAAKQITGFIAFWRGVKIVS